MSLRLRQRGVMATAASGPVATGVVLNGTASNNFTTPEAAANNVLGDLELRVKATMPDWTPTAINELFDKDTGSDPNRAWAVRLLTTGVIRLLWWSSAGSLATSDSTVAPTVANGATLSIKITVDLNNGSGSYEVKFYTSTDWDPQTDTGTWTQLGTTVTGGAVAALRDTTTAALYVGSRTDGTSATTGTIRHAQIRDGIGGAVVAKFDPSVVTPAGVRTPSTFVSGTGETWTGNGSAWDWSIT